MAYNEFPRKGYGRIFVEKESDIPIVKEIITELDLTLNLSFTLPL